MNNNTYEENNIIHIPQFLIGFLREKSMQKDCITVKEISNILKQNNLKIPSFFVKDLNRIHNEAVNKNKTKINLFQYV